jgi:hypothetical protein
MMMKWASVGLAALATVTGLVAAYYWYRASKIQIEPTWLTEPGDNQLSQMGWMAGMMRAFMESAGLNKHAAFWTAFSVALTAVSSIVGVVTRNAR